MYSNTPFDMSGRVALITGASGGLGYQFAKTLAEAGASVVVAARSADNPKLLELQQQIGADRSLRVAIDVSKTSTIDAAVDAAWSKFGTCDVLINNAGIADPRAAIDVDEQAWQALVDVNLKGVWLVARAFAQPLIERRSAGAIVNISSILSRRVAGGLMTYSVSKAGIEQMTRSLALEWARHSIRVNALAPGYILTDMNRAHFESADGQKMIRKIPQRRIGEPAELDGAILLLASSASSYMTGSSIVVDGGHLQSSL